MKKLEKLKEVNYKINQVISDIQTKLFIENAETEPINLTKQNYTIYY
jgi:hypothetical protein